MFVCQLASMSARLQSDSVVMRGDVREQAAADELSLWIWPRSDQPPVMRLLGPTAHTLKDNTAGCRTDAHFYLFFGLFIKCVGKELPRRSLTCSFQRDLSGKEIPYKWTTWSNVQRPITIIVTWDRGRAECTSCDTYHFPFLLLRSPLGLWSSHF